MGTIASVLQWTCTNCLAVNPIEAVRCSGCNTVRIVAEKESDQEGEQEQQCIESDDPGPQHSPPAAKEGRKEQHTGYLEIQADG